MSTVKFVFEDCDGEILPEFYKKFMPDKSIIEFVGGNSVLLNRVLNEENFDGFQIMFLDMNPWNVDLFNIYNKMKNKIRRTGCHYIVIPIVCSEYNYLASLTNKWVLSDGLFDKLKNVKSVAEYSHIIDGTYEDLCKYYASNDVIPAASISKKINPELDYFTKDIFEEKLIFRWFNYISKFEIVPKVSEVKGLSSGSAKSINLDGIIKFQNDKVDYFNNWKDSVITGVVQKLGKIDISWYR